MLLYMQHADVALRDCTDCWQYVYDEKTGKREERRGSPVRRPAGTSPPCMAGRCKKQHPDAFKALLPHNAMAYDYYLECKATGHFPNDPIVRRNAKIIHQIEQAMARHDRMEDTMMMLMGANRR